MFTALFSRTMSMYWIAQITKYLLNFPTNVTSRPSQIHTVVT